MDDKGKSVPLGQLLIRNRLITEEQLADALDRQKKTGHRLGHTLVNMGLVSEEDLMKVLEKQFGLPAIKINLRMLNPRVVKLIPEYICRKYRLLPVILDNNNLTIAATDPYDLGFRDEIRYITDYNSEIVLCPEVSVLEAINYIYGKKETDWVDKDVEIERGEATARISAARMLQDLLRKGIKSRAREIQIHYLDEALNIIYLNPEEAVTSDALPGFYYKAIAMRIKSLAGLDIHKKGFQDGIMRIPIEGRDYSIRALFFQNPRGENITLKLP